MAESKYSSWLKTSLVTILALALFAFQAVAAEIYVAPDGAPDGDGSLEKPLDIATALGPNSPAGHGDTILLKGGRYDGPMQGNERQAFEVAVSGAEDNPVIVRPVEGETAHLNGAIEVTSSYANFIGLEIGDLNWDPTQRAHKTPTALWATGGVGATFVNCNIFGGSMGTGLWSPARDTTLYGCLVHDFGTIGDDRGHGHAYYTQNEVGTKTIEHNIAYRGCGWNLHVYTQGGRIRGYDILENIMFIAGAVVPNQTHDNYLVAGYTPADDIRLIGNVGYQPVMHQAWRPNARMSHYRDIQNGTGEVKDNYFMGAVYGLSVGNWEKIDITGNTVWSTGVFVDISSSPTGTGVKSETTPKPENYVVAGNRYFNNGIDRAFYFGNQERAEEGDRLTFAQWREMGFDEDGEILPGRDGKPTGTETFVFPNRYENGRAHVGIFNWDGVDEVEVDLSEALEEGQAYRVYNVLDIKQTIALAEPALAGEYDGGMVAFPMRKDPISPEFDAFLVLPQ